MLLISLLVLLSGNDQIKTPAGYDAKLYQQAYALCQSAIIIDGHVDTPSILDEDRSIDIADGTSKGEFDFKRGKAGGLDAPFMSIYLDAEYQLKPGASRAHAERLISMMDSVIGANPDQFSHAFSTDDIRNNAEKGLISLPYGMENGSGIESDLSNVGYFFNKGIRYITLTHGKRNKIGDSSYDKDKSWNGISPFGKQVIAEMNKTGIIVDIAHVSDSAFYQAIRFSSTPPVATHSSCRHFTPGFERNVSDDMLKALAAKGGVLMINFGSYFLTESGNQYGERRADALDLWMKENGITSRDDERYRTERERWTKANPYPFASIQDVVNHIDRAVQVGGIDHVGIGSDYDGVGDSLPAGLKSTADYPKLVYFLLKKGYSEENIKKILGENFLRVWKQVEKMAQNSL